MKDHLRILGALFIAWGVLQAVGTFLLPVLYATEAPSRPPLFALAVLVALIAGFVWAGLRLRAHDPRARVPAIALSVISLLSFPIGTVLGGYGLWVLLSRGRLGTT